MKCSDPIITKTGIYRCGKCLACQASKTEENIIRFNAETKAFPCYFVTLTYKDECLPKNGVDKDHVLKFIHRIRKKFPCKYVAIAEYGGRFCRPHYHLLLWWLSDKPQVSDLEECWKFGGLASYPVNDKQANYVAKYHTTKVLSDDIYRIQGMPYYSRVERVFEDDSDQLAYVRLNFKKTMSREDFEKAVFVPQNKYFRLISRGVGLSWLDSPEADHVRRSHDYKLKNDKGFFNFIPRYLLEKLSYEHRRNAHDQLMRYREDFAKNPYLDLHYSKALEVYPDDLPEFAYKKYQRDLNNRWRERYEKNVIEKKMHSQSDL